MRDYFRFIHMFGFKLGTLAPDLEAINAPFFDEPKIEPQAKRMIRIV